MKSPLKSKMQNLIYVDISRFNDDDIKLFLEQLKQDSSPKNLIGFVSAFENICLYLDKIKSKPIEGLKINSIIAISEFLTSYVKNTMEKYFGVPVVSRYSNEELGIIAQQFPVKGKEEFNINWASYHVEILKMDNDALADAGEMGRVVITDLFNYCMPIIRYDTGDISTFNILPTDENPYPTLKRIEGRKMDIIYDTKGEIISSYVIYTKLYSYYHLLKQYQFIQVDEKEYHIKLNTHSKDFNYELNLTQDIQKDFGADAVVKIILVDEIPALSSGKRKKVVNLFSQKS
ncbi:MAG: hypothetical protein KUG51_02690 [Urechidicola sp.]|nr:hypothetical protein [Urechidicola sp.]